MHNLIFKKPNNLYAGVAQLAEQRYRKPQVVSSNLTFSSICLADICNEILFGRCLTKIVLKCIGLSLND